MSHRLLLLGHHLYCVTIHGQGVTMTHHCAEQTAEGAAQRLASTYPTATTIVAENLLDDRDRFELGPCDHSTDDKANFLHGKLLGSP